MVLNDESLTPRCTNVLEEKKSQVMELEGKSRHRIHIVDIRSTWTLRDSIKIGAFEKTRKSHFE